MKSDNKYTNMQREHYKEGVASHERHNNFRDYWDILLFDLKNNSNFWKDKVALDFGCGSGRNILNMFKLCEWKRVDGCDISAKNVSNSKALIEGSIYNKKECNTYLVDGVSMNTVPSDTYDFIMSTITLQHICVHEIRYNIMKDFYRCLKTGGKISFQMGYGNAKRNAVGYYENFYDAMSTNSSMDTKVEKEEFLVNDLEKIGFKNIKTYIGPSDHCQHGKWIYIKAEK